MSISVVIPVYNSEKYIEKCTLSVLKQSEVVEVIIIDDGSSDRSRSIIQELSLIDPRIQLHTHKGSKNKGSGISRNLGIQLATSLYITFLDADDYYLDDRFKNTIQYLDEATDGVYESLRVAQEATIKYPLDFHHVSQDVAPKNALEAIVTNKYGTVQLGGFTFKRDFIKSKNIQFSEHKRGQDLNLIYGACAFGRILLKSGPPVAVRSWHSDNVSHDKHQEKLDRVSISETWLNHMLQNNFSTVVNRYFLTNYLHYREGAINVESRVKRNMLKVIALMKLLVMQPKIIIKTIPYFNKQTPNN